MYKYFIQGEIIDIFTSSDRIMLLKLRRAPKVLSARLLFLR